MEASINIFDDSDFALVVVHKKEIQTYIENEMNIDFVDLYPNGVKLYEIPLDLL